LFFTFYILAVLKDIFVPIAFSTIIAILLNPLVTWLNRAGMKRVIAITIAIFVALLILTGIIYFLSSQIMSFSDNLPELKQRFAILTSQLQHWVAHTFSYSISKQNAMLSNAANSSETLIGQAAGSAISVIISLILIPVYVFVVLYYKALFLDFFHKVFAQNTYKVEEVLGETKLAIQSYMVGLLLEAIAVAALNSTALLILGVQYAILLGVIGAILNVLPYIGGIVAIALPVMIALVTHDGLSTPVYIVIAYAIIQFIDNHLLIPLLVSSRVQINAFFSILIVLLGGALWGFSGMFLSIPFLAVIKIVFDHVPELKPWGKLLGDHIPTKRKWKRVKKEDSLSEKIVKEAEQK
jgi:predicted PurR-regulated permease PerM